MDPIRALLERWRTEREFFGRSGSDELIALSETHADELEEALSTLSESTVPYCTAADLTGYALGSLKNMGLQNVGTRAEPAFRLIDLPFKAGCASPAKTLMAGTILRAHLGGLRAARTAAQDLGTDTSPLSPSSHV